MKKNFNDKFDENLRPVSLSGFIGQKKLKESLKIFIDAAKKRKETLSHVLLYGPPGLGKTTLAGIIANEMGVGKTFTSGPALERTGDLAAIISNLEPGDIFFIDEIHRMNKSVEEILYPAMEDFAIDLVLGKGPSARTMRLDLPKFTLIGATTKLGMLSSPLRDRFGVVYQLSYYQNKDIEEIITRSSKLLNISIDSEAKKIIAERSRKTPRIANRLLQRIRDFAQIKSNGFIDAAIVNRALSLLGIDEKGLDMTDKKILTSIAVHFKGGPVGLKAVAAATSEDPQTIEEVIEPYLMQIGFLRRTSQGRKITEAAMSYYNLEKGKLL